MFWEDCAVCEEDIHRDHSKAPWSHEDLALNADHNPVPRGDKPPGPKRYADYHVIDLVNDDVRDYCRTRGMTWGQFSDFLVAVVERTLEDAKQSQRTYNGRNKDQPL